MRKKLIAVVGAALLLTGCSAPPQPDVAESPESVVADVSTPEDEFIEAFRAANPDSDRATDEQWLDIATAVCEALESGASPNQVIDVMQGDDSNPDEMASLVILSTEHLCPEFSPG